MVKIIDIYEQCINNAQILQHGDQYLSQYLLNTPTFIEESLQLIFDQNYSQRKYICVLFKNVLILNWEQVQQKQTIIENLARAYLNEPSEHIQQITLALLCELIRREQLYSIIPFYLEQPKQHAIDALIYLIINLDSQINQYAKQLLQFSLTNNYKTYELLYHTVNSFSMLENTDVDALHAIFDESFIPLMEKFQLVLQNYDNIIDHIYVIKTLNIIFKEMKKYSKQLRKQIIPFIASYISKLPITQLDNINFYDDQLEIEPNLEVLLYYTLQIVLSLNNQQLCNELMYNQMFRILNLPFSKLQIQQFVDEDEASVKKACLYFFESQFANNKTKQFAKQTVLNFITQYPQSETTYLLLENHLIDVIEPNSYYVLIDQILSHPITIRTLTTSTSIYQHSQGDQQYFQKLFLLNQQYLQQQLGIICLFNIGKLSAHAIKNNTITQQQELNIQLPNYDQDSAHLYFDSVLSILKLFQNSNIQILPQIAQYWHQFPHDNMVIQIFIDLIDHLAQTQWQQIYDLFNQSTGYMWITVMISLAKQQPTLLQNKILPLTNFMLQPQNYEYLCQCTMLLKTLLLSNTIDQNTYQQVLKVLEFQLSIHNDVEIEASTSHVHSLLLVVWNKFLNREVNGQVILQVKQKILYTETPSTVIGLYAILSAMLLKDQNYVQQLIQEQDIQLFLIKWLRYADLSAQLKNQSILFQNCLQRLLMLQQIDHLYFIDPFTGKINPMRQKIEEYLKQGSKKPIDLSDDNDFYDIEEQENEFDNEISILLC